MSDKLEELKEHYYKISQEVFDANAVLDGHYAFNTFGRTLEETTNFHKSFAKAKLNYETKISEQNTLIRIIKKMSEEKTEKEALA